MKKIISVLLAMLLLGGGALMTSCAENGQSAYEIAVKHGFEGSEEDWLLSLQGKDGADGADGTDGSDGADGKDGADGTIVSTGNMIGDTVEAGGYQTALLSSVSVYCNFIEVTQGWGWGGHSNQYESSATSAGSGVIFQLDKENGDAYIITNYHVVYDSACNTDNKISDDISIYLYGMEDSAYAIPATYVGGSMNYDIAVLKVTGSELLKQSNAKAAMLAAPHGAAVGMSVVAIGNPEAKGISMTRGIVSVDSESLTMIGADGQSQITYRAIRVDTAVNSGNSGGGLFDLNGQLIGIVNAKIVDDGIEGIAYAIPISIAAGVAQNIIDNSEEETYTDGVWKCLLGITVKADNARTELDETDQLVHIREDVIVESVTEDSLTDGVLQTGDQIISLTVNGETYEATRTFVIVDAMLNARVGDSVTVTVLRDGTEIDVEFEITADCISVYR